MEPRKGIWLLLLLTLSPVLWGQYYSSDSKKAIKRFEEARDCLKQGDPACAEEALLKAIKADEQFIEAFQLLAQLSYDRGEMEQAISYYGRTLEIDPEGNPEAYRLLAGLRLMNGDYAEARQLALRYLSFSPEKIRNQAGAESLLASCHFALEAMEREHIIRVMREMEGNVTRSAKGLGIDRATLYNKIKKYGIQR